MPSPPSRERPKHSPMRDPPHCAAPHARASEHRHRPIARKRIHSSIRVAGNNRGIYLPYHDHTAAPHRAVPHPTTDNHTSQPPGQPIAITIKLISVMTIIANN